MATPAAMGQPATDQQTAIACDHCGEPCDNRDIGLDDKVFCCTGCRTVYELLSEQGLDHYYDLGEQAGTRPTESTHAFAHLDDPAVQERLLSFRDGELAVVTFRIPAIHCVACIWLLENLYRLHPAIQRSQVNFPRKEVFLQFRESDLSLRELVTFLARLGYEPLLRLDDLSKDQNQVSPHRSLYIKLGVAGFAFSNIMLLSFPGYFGMSDLDANFRVVFGYLNIALSLPVLFYSASDYLRAAWTAIRRRTVTIELPIAIGIVALYSHSLAEILTDSGLGYLDSFTGLIFFLLIGRVFQTKTYDALSFDRDFTAYFPLQVCRQNDDGEETSIPLTRLAVGDRIVVRNQEIIPADAMLDSDAAEIDYSFVTGEADPMAKHRGEPVYAGGRQVGAAASYIVTKAVDQSHLTQLWNNPQFTQVEDDLSSLTNRISKYFTLTVVAIATGSALYWWQQDVATAVRSFVSVLIIACPCALALSAPFTMGTLIRLFARQRCFARSALVLEKMARADHLVFDKTGTLTSSHSEVVAEHDLNAEEEQWVRTLASQSTHPLSVRLCSFLSGGPSLALAGIEEHPGSGLQGQVDGHLIRLGSANWTSTDAPDERTAVYLSIDGHPRGRYLIEPTLRERLPETLRALRQRYPLTLLSGDSDRHAETLAPYFGENATMHFRQSPQDKLRVIAELQDQGKQVLMVGDGLNDAGALKQSDVGIAVTDDLSAFSPACDIILDGEALERLPRLMRVARAGIKIVAISFAISLAYNIIGISFAARGVLSPLVSAILMPLSSATVIAFAVASSILVGKAAGLKKTG